MKGFIFIVLMVSIVSADTLSGSRIDRVLTEQRQIFQDKHPRIFMFGGDKKTYEKVDKAIPDTVITILKEDTVAISRPSESAPMSAPVRSSASATGYGSGIGGSSTHMSGAYVSYEVYYRDMMDMQKRITALESVNEKVITAIEGTQKMGVDNKRYSLDLLNIILTFLGTGGVAIIGLLITYFTRKKKSQGS